MKLTWRDGVATSFVALTTAIAVAVVRDLGWPLLGSPRAGIAAMGVAGYAMCAFSMASTKMTGGKDLVRGPFMIAASALGTISLALIVAGLIVTSDALVVALAIDLLLTWLVALSRHAVEGARLPVRHAA